MDNGDGMLDRALDTQRERERERERREAAEALAATQPCPPDPVLDQLFRDFAARMKGRQTLALVRLSVSQETVSRKVGGRFSHKTEAMTVYHEHEHEIARGWLTGLGRTHQTSPGGVTTHGWISESTPPTYRTNALVVTTDGRPWFTSYSGTGEPEDRVVVDDPPLGPSLRAAIIGVLDLDVRRFPGVEIGKLVTSDGRITGTYPLSDGHEQLPGFIAEAMAKAIDS